MIVELIGNNGLPAFVHMHMAHGLLARLAPPELTVALSEALTNFCGKCAKADLIP